MHILNVMFGRNVGGIEQSFLDYCCALQQQKIQVTALIHPKCALKKELELHGVNYIELSNKGAWDPIARLRFKRLVKQNHFDAQILHGNRALSLCSPAKIPSIGVTHNYQLKHMKGLDAIFYTTNDLKQALIKEGLGDKKLFYISNMIDEKQIDSTLPYSPSSPPTIGSMGRYVHKKGFHIYLEALAILKEKKLPFRAVLAGKGEEENALQDQANNLNLNDILTFDPWVEDKNQFYKNIDIFCLPSLHEPFGIILLEALLAGKACAVVESEGPSEIIKSQEYALTCPVNNAKALAEILETLINEPKIAQKIAEKAKEAAEPFLQERVAKSIKEALISICQSA